MLKIMYLRNITHKKERKKHNTKHIYFIDQILFKNT